MPSDLLVAASAVAAGGIAAMSGFGIGSFLTPVFSPAVGTKLAVAVVAIPHFIGTVLRLWILRRHVDRRVLLGFGITSALGGLAGALLHAWTSSRALTLVFGALLVLAGVSQWSGWMARVRWGRRAAWVAGAVSGLLGGLVGNQGGIRSASMLGFEVPKESFVATATAVALFVDLARLPVYLATQGEEIADAWRLILVASIGVVLGTTLGVRFLRYLPEIAFRRFIAAVLALLGLSMLLGG